MKSRFAPVKRPLLALTVLVAIVAATGAMPAANASTPIKDVIYHNNLSFPGTTGLIRVRPVVQDNKGATHLNSGDPNIKDGNPNTTIGDGPYAPPTISQISSNFYSQPCTGSSFDCVRVLANNDPSVNASATGGITRYNPGDTAIIVNDVAGFQKGDTLLIGSPYCNFPTLGNSCKKFLPGFGVVNEQPAGEVVHVAGGDVNSSGVGVLQLLEPLTQTHLEGSQVTKLPTLYQGQQFRVDIDYAALLNCDLAFTTCNFASHKDPNTGATIVDDPGNVNVTADFIPPEGSHDPAFPSRPLPLSRDNQNGPFTTSVPGDCHPTFTTVPKVSGTATGGSTTSLTDTTKDFVNDGIVAGDTLNLTGLAGTPSVPVASITQSVAGGKFDTLNWSTATATPVIAGTAYNVGTMSQFNPAPAHCGAGFASFYIPSNITEEATVGHSFSTDTPDNWYSVIITATDAQTGAVVADGMARFKLNPVAITNLKAKHPTDLSAGPATFFPGEAVQISGFLRDATALDRPVENVLTSVEVDAPQIGGGFSSTTFLTNSCWNTNSDGAFSAGKDSCGGNPFDPTQDGHGSFYVQYGGPEGVFVSFDTSISPWFGIPPSVPPSAPPTPSDFTPDGLVQYVLVDLLGVHGSTTCNPETNFVIIPGFLEIPCVNGLLHVTDTLNTGTYTVIARLYNFRPAVTAQTTFDVKLV
ncbi:MAG: hypothetical protein ACYDCC_01820 [Actinomycetota bacterium]